MIKAGDLGRAGCKYLGTPYSTMDCQAFVEKCLKDCGNSTNLAGSNAWYRKVMKEGWVGTPEECRKKYGLIPEGAFLFILKTDGGEPEKYKGDGIGNASHIGIYTGMTGKRMVQIGKEAGDSVAGGFNYGDGAINSSSIHGAVCTSNFAGRAINGGWNRIGLWLKKIDYGVNGGDEPVKTMVVKTDNGGKLNLRAGASTKDDVLEQIPNGTKVEVLVSSAGGWSKISYNGTTGYVMSKYLTDETGGGGDTVTVSREELQAIYDIIGDMLKGE